MKANELSLDINQQVAQAPELPAGADLAQGKTAFPLSPNAATRWAPAICETEDSQPKPEAKHWLEAEAQLFGGLERESQMRPGSSLFTTEH